MGLTVERGHEALPTVRASQLAPEAPEQHWLVTELWGQGAVGILGGHPKSCKSWLGLELAVAVASGRPCLSRFSVDKPGTALIYLAEDSLPMVRARLTSICEARGIELASLELHVITSPSLRLDSAADCSRLAVTLQRLRPQLLVLDPLVRLHRLDENNASEMSGLLSELRELQRRFDVAIVLVHHTRKRTAASPGEALRGSSDLYAWTDVTAHVARTAEGQLVLTVEHRSAPSPEPITLALVSRADGSRTHLEIVEGGPRPSRKLPRTLEQTVLEALADSSNGPLGTEALRTTINVQKQRLVRALHDLEKQGLVSRDGPRGGWLRVRDDGQATLPITATE
ncbi:MAG: AAA family ATPase [Candidatus Wallbacteria bacterium]|nr:AAA family ATPase [Candidatus Wallbacteria bacterium]